jgi:hypothetical protein
MYQQLWGYKVKDKLYLGVREQKRLNTTAIGHSYMRVKHCAYGHRVATLLNPRGVTTVSYKYSLTVARHASVVVAVPSTVRYPVNY